MDFTPYIPWLIAVVILILLFIFLATHRKTALPNEVLIISGALISGKHSFKDVNGNRVKLITNGGSFILPILQRWDVLSLNTRTIEVATPEVYTQQGVPIIVNGTVILKIGSSQEEVATAAEQFLGKNDEQINSEATEILEGHLRAILGTLTVEDTYQNRDAFAEKVQDVASSDLAKMGLQIISFTIKDIADKNGYLDSLGKKQIAEVKKNAAMAEAAANRDTRIQQAQADQEAKQQEIERQTQVADAQREQQVRMADFKKQQEIAQAQADQAAIVEQMKAKQVQKEKDIELAQRDAELQEQQLNATVRKQADADLYKAQRAADAQKAAQIAAAEASAKQVELAAEADAKKVELAAQAEANKVKLAASADAERTEKIGQAEAAATTATGQAEAAKIKAMGLAQAEAIAKQAEAAKQLDESGRFKMTIEAMPKIIEAAMSPYANVDSIKLYGDGDLTGQTNGNLVKQLDMLNEVAGIDIRGMLNGALTQQAGNKPIVDALKEPAEAQKD
ncbi:flotillin family protein [Lacticaseibacillus daqingensis]|uniref:flotillin family protein n=1 Tax=Lacticaseibacillus daqingensis TaxID=2486014 RepID=UPI0038513247